jgi:hypothetical protein
MLRTALHLLSLTIVACLAGGSAQAKTVCEKQCFEAQTCPTVGTKCLKFNWCRDVCREEDREAPREEGEKPAPPLSGPQDGQPKTEL